VARRSGRELLREQGQLEDEREDLEEEAKTLRAQAEQARRTAAEAPALRRAAEERILARERIAAGDAAHDLKQGEYLESLIEPEYMKERADVESGVSGWRVDGGEEAFGASWTVRLGFAIVATLGAGALAFWVVGGVPAVVFTSLIVAVAFAVAFLGGGDSDEASESRRERPLQYVARLVASARKGSERATDIEELVPFPPPQPEFDTGRNGRENGAGNGKAKQRSRAELVNVVEKIRQALDG
jgi:hypothetical protein